MTAGDNQAAVKKQSTLFTFFKPNKDNALGSSLSQFKSAECSIKDEQTRDSADLVLDSKVPSANYTTKRVRVSHVIAQAGLEKAESCSASQSSSGSSENSSSSDSDDSSSSGASSLPDAKKARIEVPSVDVEKLFIFHTQNSVDESQEFLTPQEPPSIRREFCVNMKSTSDSFEPILSVEEIDKLCKNVPQFVRSFTNLYYEYCNRFDFPSWYNPKNLKDKDMRAPTDPDYDVGTLYVPRKNGKVTEEGHSTPMLQQYWEIKQNHFNEIILFKVGKFYELFYIDAAIAQSVCNLKWMGHDRRAHVGFPEVSLEHHASSLIDQGYTVCVVEQTETVSEANERSGKATGALVERQICQVFTTGTLIHDSMLTASDSAHYICAIYMSSKITAVIGDCSTGRFTIHSVGNLNELKTLLFTFNPKEILHSPNDQLAGLLAGYRELTSCVVARWAKWDGPGIPKEVELDSNLSSFISSNNDVKKCISGIVNYLDHLLLHDQVTMCSTWEMASSVTDQISPHTMVLDSTVLSHLEILRDSENSERGSLLKFLNQTKTKFGTRLMRNWICAPLINIELISARQDAVEFFMKSKGSRKIFETVAEMGDLERTLQRICAQALQQSRAAVFFNSVENKRIANFLSFLDSIVKSCGLLEKLGSDAACPPLIASLTDSSVSIEIRKICEFLKSSVCVGKDDFTPKPGSFPDYDDCVSKIKAIESELKVELDRVRSDVVGSNEPVFVSVKYRYEIEVPLKYEKVIKENDSFEITSGRKGYVRFLTENVKELVARLELEEQKKTDLLYPFMSKLFSELNNKRFLFNSLIHRFAQLDCLHALAIVSNASAGYVRPQFGSVSDLQKNTTIRLINSRHPVQEFLMQLERPFVPNDIVVGESASTLLVTGANMGGKSTILRQICINVILAQIGCFVPATECFISHPIDRIFTRIGASDNILEGKSTFLTELEETAVILSEATRRSLVVIDELGRGTSTFDGVAIAGATLEHISKKIECTCLFATHYHKLCDKTNLKNLNKVELFHMECKSNGTEIELTHKFKPGSYPHSQAIHVARIAGIPESILSEAEKVSQQFLTSIGG